MSRESKRPGKTERWNINSPVTIHVQPTDIIEYATVNKRGDTIHRSPRKGWKATVLVGHKEGKKITVTPEDAVFTCLFGFSGHLSTLPPEYVDKEVTIISHSQ